MRALAVVLTLLGLATAAYAWTRANDAQAWARLGGGDDYGGSRYGGGYGGYDSESRVAAARFGPKARRDALGAGTLSVALLTGAVAAAFRARRARRPSA